MNVLAKIILCVCIAVVTVGADAAASGFRELHVSGPCEVRLIFNPDSAGIVTVARGSLHSSALMVRRNADAVYIVMPPDSIVDGLLPLKVYSSQNLTLIDASGRAVVKAGEAETRGHIAVVASGAASVSLAAVTANNVNISLTGSGIIDVAGGLTAATVNLSLTGSGKIKADAVATNRLSVTQRGSGKITTAGSAHNCAIVGQGSGIVDARSLVSADMNLKLFGPGQIYYPAGVRATLGGKVDNIHAVKPYQPL